MLRCATDGGCLHWSGCLHASFLIWRVSGESSVGSVEAVEVLPLLELVVEQFGGVDSDTVEHSVELFLVDTVGPFDAPMLVKGLR